MFENYAYCPNCGHKIDRLNNAIPIWEDEDYYYYKCPNCGKKLSHLVGWLQAFFRRLL